MIGQKGLVTLAFPSNIGWAEVTTEGGDIVG